MPLRASRSEPPADMPLDIAGLFPSSVMSWMVTLLACTRMMLLAAVALPHSELPAHGFGIDTAGSTVVAACPAPSNVSCFVIVTFSWKTPLVAFTVSPFELKSIAFWMHVPSQTAGPAIHVIG